MSPEISKAPRRWVIVSLAIILLSLVAIISVVLSARAYKKAADSTTKVLAFQVKADQDAALRTSEKRSAKLRAQGLCRQSKKGTKQIRTVVEDLRSTYLELAAKSINSASAEVLRRRARNLPVFPEPTCDPGPKPKKAPKKAPKDGKDS